MDIRDQIRGTRGAVRTVQLEGAEWRLRKISAAEGAAFADFQASKPTTINSMCRLVGTALADRDGRRALDQADEGLLAELPFAVLRALFDAAAEHNGLTAEAADAAEGN